MNAELLMQVKALDPAPADSELPTGMAPAERVLATIDERSRTVQTKERVDVKRPEPQRRWAPALVALGAFVAVLAVGAMIWLIGVGGGGDVAESTTTTTTTQLTTTTAEAQPPTEEAAGATPLTTTFGSLAPGTYRLDTLGTPLTFTVENPVFFVMENRSGFFALAPPNSQDFDDRDMVILRLAALSDPAAPNASRADQGEGWPADDFGGWLDNLTDGVLATHREDTTLGGLPAIRADLELGDIECPSGNTSCALFDLSQRKPLNPGAKYRIWVVEQENAEPLAVILGITNESDLAWWDAYEDILSTLAFDGALQ